MGCARTQLDEADEAKRVYEFKPTQIIYNHFWICPPFDLELLDKVCGSTPLVSQTMGAFDIYVSSEKRSERTADQDATQTTETPIEATVTPIP